MCLKNVHFFVFSDVICNIKCSCFILLECGWKKWTKFLSLVIFLCGLVLIVIKKGCRVNNLYVTYNLYMIVQLHFLWLYWYMLWKHFSWIRPKTLAFSTSGVHIFVYEINLFKTFWSLKCLDWGTGLIQTTNYLVHLSFKLYWAFLTTSCLSTCKIMILFSRTTGPFSSKCLF